jgi:hypothetical protein
MKAVLSKKNYRRLRHFPILFLIEMTRTGRLFTEDKSLNGTGIRTISPRLYIIPDLIVFVIPKARELSLAFNNSCISLSFFKSNITLGDDDKFFRYSTGMLIFQSASIFALNTISGKKSRRKSRSRDLLKT